MFRLHFSNLIFILKCISFRDISFRVCYDCSFTFATISNAGYRYPKLISIVADRKLFTVFTGFCFFFSDYILVTYFFNDILFQELFCRQILTSPVNNRLQQTTNINHITYDRVIDSKQIWFADIIYLLPSLC